MKVKPLSKDKFLIQSHTDINTWYEVDLIYKTCTCPHYKIRLQYRKDETCKHYDDLMEYLTKDIESKEEMFTKIENEIKNNGNFVEWNTKNYDDKVINQMIHLGRLYQPKNGFLAVL